MWGHWGAYYGPMIPAILNRESHGRINAPCLRSNPLIAAPLMVRSVRSLGP